MDSNKRNTGIVDDIWLRVGILYERIVGRYSMDVGTVKTMGRKLKRLLTLLCANDQVNSPSGDETNVLFPLLRTPQVIDILTAEGGGQEIGQLVLHRTLNVVLKSLWKGL